MIKKIIRTKLPYKVSAGSGAMQQSGRNIQILGIKCADIVIVGFWTLLLAVLASLGCPVVHLWVTLVHAADGSKQVGHGMFINHGGCSNNSTAVLCGP